MSSVIKFVLAMPFFQKFLEELTEPTSAQITSLCEGPSMWRAGVCVIPTVVFDGSRWVAHVLVEARQVYEVPDGVLKRRMATLDFKNRDLVMQMLKRHLELWGFNCAADPDKSGVNRGAWWSSVGASLGFRLGWRQDVRRILGRSPIGAAHNVVDTLLEQQRQEKFFVACRRVAQGCSINGGQLDIFVSWANNMHDMFYIEGVGYDHNNPMWGHVFHWFLEARKYEVKADCAFGRDLNWRQWEQAARACLVIALNPGRVDKTDCDIIFEGLGF